MRWVYKTVRVNVGRDYDHRLIERKLNELGGQGWELVSTILASDLLVVCVLKRRWTANGQDPATPVRKGTRKRKGE